MQGLPAVPLILERVFSEKEREKLENPCAFAGKALSLQSRNMTT
jgi:hypothetical protein